jgi:hypothetical protein
LKKGDREWEKREKEIKDLLSKYKEHFDNTNFDWE